MRTGGANATFSYQIGQGRVDITIARGNDSLGASGAGLLGSVLFDAVSAGDATLVASSTATALGGTQMGMQLRPVTVSIEP